MFAVRLPASQPACSISIPQFASRAIHQGRSDRDPRGSHRSQDCWRLLAATLLRYLMADHREDGGTTEGKSPASGLRLFRDYGSFPGGSGRPVLAAAEMAFERARSTSLGSASRGRLQSSTAPRGSSARWTAAYITNKVYYYCIMEEKGGLKLRLVSGR